MKIEKTLLPRTVAEKQEFSRLGVAVRSALIASAVIDKGAAALLRIRDGQLYREDFESYDAYLASEGITRRRADQLVAFFKIQQGVSNTLGTAVPETFDTLSERSLRPLVGMPSEVAAAAVLEAAASPGGISPKSIAVAAKRRKKAVRKPVFKSRRFLVPGAVVSVTFNRKSNGSLLDVIASLTAQVERELERNAADAA
jgi:hypothetical protein